MGKEFEKEQIHVYVQRNPFSVQLKLTHCWSSILKYKISSKPPKTKINFHLGKRRPFWFHQCGCYRWLENLFCKLPGAKAKRKTVIEKVKVQKVITLFQWCHLWFTGHLHFSVDSPTTVKKKKKKRKNERLGSFAQGSAYTKQHGWDRKSWLLDFKSEPHLTYSAFVSPNAHCLTRPWEQLTP